MVDKYEVKKWVADKIGEEYIIPTLGVWDKFDDIDFAMLPNQFVLKCTHDSGGLVICKDKESLDKEKAKAKIEKSLKRNFYYAGREWPYKNVKPRIIAEKFMSDDKNDELIDYKFYCFHGKPQFLYVSQGMANHSMARLSYVSLAWEKMKFSRKDYKEFEVLPEKPSNFEKMIELAGILSEDIPFVRVDFYEIQWKMYFGEMTFYPCAGFAPFTPEEYDMKLGKLLKLPEKNKG